MTQEALKLALEAHKKNERHNTVAETRYWCDQYKLLAEQALARPEQEPVKYSDYEPDGVHHTTPPQRKPLTDEEIEREWQFLHDEEGNPPDHHDFARAIEAAHGIREKNNVAQKTNS